MKLRNFLIFPVLPIAGISIVCSLSAHAETGVWNNFVGGSWGTAGNWTGVTPGASGGIADFGQSNLTADATVTLDGDRTVGSLNFGDAVVGSHNWILNAGSGGKLTLERAIGAGTPTINVFNQTTTIGAVIDGTQGLTKTGLGTLTLNGASANTFTGDLSVLGGNMTLNYANFGSNNNLINSSNKLTLAGGGKLTLSGSGSNTQAFNGLHLQGGVNALAIGSSQTISLGAITRDVGGCINLPGGGTITTSNTSNPNGILGTWATVNVTSNARYAYWNGTKLAAYTGAAAATADLMTGTDGTANYEFTGSTTATTSVAVGAGLSANTIRFNNASFDHAITGDFSINGLMNVNSKRLTISNNVTIGDKKELVVHIANGGGITFGGAIKDYDATPEGVSALTINIAPSAGNNTVTLGTANTYRGLTTINGQNPTGNSPSTITIASLPNGTVASSVFGTGNTIALNGAAIQVTDTTAARTSDRNFNITGVSGIYHKGTTAARTLTLSGNINGTGSLLIDGDSNAAGVVLTGNNGFTGDLKLQTDGKVILGSVNAIQNATLDMTGQRITADLATNNLAYTIGGLKGNNPIASLGTATASSGSGFVTIGGNNQSNDYWGAISGGSAGLIKTGSGVQIFRNTLAYTGATKVNEGTVKLDSIAAQSAVSFTVTGGSTIQLTAAQVAQMYVGQIVTNTGSNTNIPANTKIVSIDLVSNRVTLNNTPTAGTADFAGASGSFAPTSTIEVQQGAFLDVSAVSAFTLASNQTIQGKGTVIGTMTVAGTLSPGSSPGTLTTGSEVWSNGGDYNWQVQDASGSAGSGYDTIAVNGTLDLSGLTTGGFSLNLWTLAGLSPDANGEAINFNNASDYAWTILSTTGGLLNFEESDFSLNTGAGNGTSGFSNDLAGGAFSLTTSGDNKNLILKFNAAAVPEPSSMILGGLGALALLRRRRS